MPWREAGFGSIVTLALLVSACGQQAAEEENGVGGTSAGGSAGSGGSGGLGSSGGLGASGGSAGGDGGTFACTSSASAGAMVSVPAGDFTMGCNAAVDEDCLDDEKPMRTVFVSAFEIDVTEVNQEQYGACVASGDCDPPMCEWDCERTSNPASCVTWDQAKMFCAWAAKRLPTEAEWEKAARGTDGRKYPWGNEEPTCERANMTGCGEKAAAVGSHPDGASPYGVHDMAGNQVEMLSDWYDPEYYQTAPNSDPEGPLQGYRYVGRGGGYKSKPLWQRTSSRDWYDLTDFGSPLGFRCAR